MTGSASVRRIGPDDWADWRLLRQRSLSEDPGAFSSSTKMWSGDLDTEQRWRDRIADGPCFIAYVDDVPVAMVAGREVDTTAELISMWVAPEVRRRHLGSALIEAVVTWSGGRTLSLRVMDGNRPAIAAYQRHGFVLENCGADSEGCQRMLRHA
ncbi:GNAT family N-acetyltransferase [Aeromicrobium sp.]|uniref:GNAT family N-acetyltransferase n=1 Tax=Aeromicrobium sp. TaxID=1871063 RepID=UPI003C4E83DC